MTNKFSRVLAAMFIGGLLLSAPGLSLAEKGDCGQPSSTGAGPKASDAQTILKDAVGQATDCDAKQCICDVNNSGGTNTTDALLTLKKAVGQDVALTCNCPPGGPACTSGRLTTQAGSDLDSGWTGIAHNSDVIIGASITARVKRECSVSTDVECEQDADCPGSETCEPTCDCINDKSCEITGPTGPKKCINNLNPCTTNADCGPDVACVYTFGPPLPLSSGGTPVCVISVFDGPLTGTADSGTGEAVASSNLRSRVFLGISIDKPCPRCGAPNQNPKVGDTFTCDGGPNNGQTCKVEGVTVDFGGTSSKCPPDLGANVSGSGLAIRFNEVTTGTTSKTAQLPCKFFGFTGNPTVPGSNPKCLDKTGAGDPVCTSNADCTRCTGNPSITCASNADCTGAGTCAQAPDQPVTCGFWCNCGFCNNNPSLPCFQNGDCPDGQTCQQGTGTGTQPNSPQQRPNDCSSDKFICGTTEEERCATSIQGTCSAKPYYTCSSDQDCTGFNAGTCVFEFKPCFESRITRTGVPSPLGTYCAFENKTCTSNADCTGTDDFCVEDSARPQTVALFCVPATSSSTVNSAGGITGPGAVRLNSFMEVCRCGDSTIGCDEQCDDGNTVNGDGCDDLCQTE